MFGTANYTYDTLDNLKRVQVTGGTQIRDQYYCYSSTTNRLDFVRSGSNCASSPAVIALTYDVQGNLANKNGVTTTFDYGNRLRSTAGLTYRYDAQGRRVRQDTGNAQLKYSFYALDGRVTWQRDEVASKRLSNIYFNGSLVAELARPIGSSTVTLSYYHTDALGSPIAKTNASKVVLETSEYEPYGKLLNRANDDRAGYTGHVMDSASGLTYMQQRYYDPQIGRFLSVDPVTAISTGGASFNRYWYGNNNPYKFTDPDGRQSRTGGSHPEEDREEKQRIMRERQLEIKRIKQQERRAKNGHGVAKKDDNSSNNGWYVNRTKLNYETEAVAAYGIGLRQTRNWATNKDATGLVVIGIGAAGKPGKIFSGLPSFDLVSGGYRWGNVDAPVDISISAKIFYGAFSVNFDPGSGIEASFNVAPALGGYVGVSVMFDDTLVPD